MTLILAGLLGIIAAVGWWQWAKTSDDISSDNQLLGALRKLKEKDAAIETLLEERQQLLSENLGLVALLDERGDANALRMNGKVGRA